jgi:hypothetical protein
MAKIRVEPKVVEAKRKLSMSLPASLVEKLDLYAQYLGGATDRFYVIEQVLAQFLDNDRDFQEWLRSNGKAPGQ